MESWNERARKYKAFRQGGGNVSERAVGKKRVKKKKYLLRILVEHTNYITRECNTVWWKWNRYATLEDAKKAVKSLSENNSRKYWICYEIIYNGKVIITDSMRRE